MLLVSSCSCLYPFRWSQVLSWEWRCSWSSADRRCSNYIWVINNLIACLGASYIRDLTVYIYIYICICICASFSLDELADWSLGHNSLTIFSTSMANSHCSHSNSNEAIATKFCAWHDSCAVVACEKVCCDMMTRNGIIAKLNFGRRHLNCDRNIIS